ncbi:MAG: tRNA (N6-isopentenyl adenosine(37)-C2)-methylthiotransferase MiaB, partial [Candidatus Omnitrophica bacterium]|nr:tRNA (N6-isopentenyl adenosine(37)-C2)-methylthiotransferase MiaB [Candidatus Omnitrophota bacterium]
RTFGCQMNVRDSEVVAGILKQAGYSLVDDQDKADIVIFNTCSVRQHAEDKVWSAIGNIGKICRPKPKQKVKKVKPLIGMIGCMAQNYQEHVFERCGDVDFVVGPSDIAKIPAILEKLTRKSDPLFQIKVWETEALIRPEEIYHTGYHQDKEHAYVVISEGCSNYCSYCVVPFVRGQLHNRRKKEIIREIEGALEKGIIKITLLGQNVNAFKDGQLDFIDLLRTVNGLPGLKEFTFVTSHPRDTTIELLQAMAVCDKLKKNLHLPVQSGSDKILKSMNRGYTRKFYLDLADNYRKIVTGGGLTTDIIVGFCGETENDFQKTYDLVKSVRFDAAYIFKYSPRPNTEALKWVDDVPQEEKERRHSQILELQKKIFHDKKAKNE